MKRPIRGTGKASSMYEGLLTGGVISLSLTVLLTGLLAKLVEMEKIPLEKVGYGIMIVLLTASYAAAVTAAGKVKRRILLVSMASGAVYLGELLVITALFFGGQYQAVGVTAALILSGSTAAALIYANKTRKKPAVRKRKAV